MWVSSYRHAPAALPLGKKSESHSTEGWVDCRAGLDGCVKTLTTPGFDPRTWLYRLSYRGHI